MNKALLILLGIILLGAVLRFYNLGSIPASLNWDEVSWGYNAYSILETGKDEYGENFPLSFRAFNDFKQPTYVYLQIVPIALFGLEAFSVRLPSALLGTLTIPFVYLLTRELFRKRKHIEALALFASFAFAVSPWSIQFSRVAFEANVALFFIVSGAYFFLSGVNKKNIYLISLGLVIISISSFTYHSAKIFTPLLVTVLFLVNYKYFWSNKKVFVIVALIYLFVNSLWLFDMRTTSRGRSVLFTSNQTEILKSSLPYIIQDENEAIPINNMIHNRRVVYAKEYIGNYLSHFDPNFLFVKGDNARHHAPGMGVLYLTFLPLIIVGTIVLAKAQEREKWIVFAWILLAPLASSLAVDAPNASRSLVFLPMWDILAAFGAISIYTALKKRKVILTLLILIFIANLTYFVARYFITTDIYTAPYWQYGYKEAIEYANKNSDQNIYFSKNFEQPYVFYLFHTKYDPKKYLSEGGSYRTEDKCYKIENISFGDCKIESEDHILLTPFTHKVPDKEVIETIRYPDGTDAVYIYKETEK